MNTAPTDRLLSVKELAAALGRHRSYVSAMRRAGYRPELPPNWHSLAKAFAWLQAHPGFRLRSAYPRQGEAHQSRPLADRMRDLQNAAANRLRQHPPTSANTIPAS